MKKPVHSVFAYSKSLILALASLFFLYGISEGQTVRYVTTIGNDGTGDGTSVKPYLTILKAITAATTVNGDTIKVAPGTYTAAATTTVSKSLAIIGTGAAGSDVILDRGTYASSAINGFTVTARNVTIRNMKVTRFETGVTTTGTAATNLTLDNVQLVENYGAGFYSTVKMDTLVIINSTLSYNGHKPGFTSVSPIKRGIYLLNGPTYSKIYFNNNTVEYNDSTGIEISSVSATTSIDSLTITNNRVRYNGDVQISTWLGTSTPLKRAILIDNNTIVLSDTSRYGIEIRNPSGNGTSSGTGSVVVSNNNITVVSHTGNSRDMAAIAIIRRKEGAAGTVNDQPQGVVVSGNTISDFQNPKAGDAYGIVLGGTGHKVFGNTITNTEFSIQLQKGNTNSGANTSSPNAINQTNTAYFDRDNSKDVCVEVGSNTITGSGAARLTTAAGTTSLTLPANRTTNTTFGVRFCTLQQAIDFKGTVAGNTITADAGTYDEQVTISKGVIIDGTDTTRIATFTGSAASPFGIFTISAKDVTVKNFKFITDLSKVNSAIISSTDVSNLVIAGNMIYSDISVPGTYKGGYSTRNGIYITNTSTNLTIQSNTINSRNGGTFRAGVAVDNSIGLLVGGNNVSDGNNFLASVNHDVIIKSYNGAQTVKNNIFKGGGVEVSNSAGDGAFIVSNNSFDGTYSHTIPTAMVRIFTNASLNRTINFSYNTFINQKWTVSFENTRNVTLDHNNITAVYDSFRLISVNTKLRQTTAPAILETIDIKLTNNNLYAAAGLTTGNALEFLNFDQLPANNYVNGNYVIGEAGNENTFNANIPTFIKVSNLNGIYTLDSLAFLTLYPEYIGVQDTSTTGYWTRDIFARYNKFYVNGQLKLATSFSTDDYNKVYAQIFDRQDDINIGAVVLMPTWSGAKNTDWADSSNWSYKFSPAPGLDAVIYPQVNQPELFADAACDTIILSNSMTVKTGTHSLTVFGNIRSNGTMDATIGSIILAGNVPQILSGLMVVKNLTLNNTTGATIAAGDSNKLTLRGIYTPILGLLNTNDNMVLKSDSAGTASISSSSSGGGYIIGKVTVERYIPAHKAWQFLSIPTNTIQTVKETWQEGASDNTSNPVPGYGAQITGVGGIAAGFDLYSATPSMKAYNSATNTWVGITNTSSVTIKATNGYMTFIRGDRTANAFNSVPTQTVLRTKGNLYTGDLPPIAVPANKFAAIGNPYASALDMRNITNTGLKNFFYTWDPNLGGSKGLGAYQTFSYNGSDYEVTPGMGSYGAAGSVSNYIQSGQAFLVQATGTGGSLTFTEAAKSGGSNLVSAVAGLTQAQLRTSLYGVNADSSTYMIDGVLNNYDDSYSNSVDDMDAIKSTNVSENLSIKTANTLLAIERRFGIAEKDTIFLNLANEKVQKYRFVFAAAQLNQPGLTGFLEDSYLNTSTPLNLRGSTPVDFNIVNIPGSYAPNRFRIVFKQLSTLPVTFTSVKAYQESKNVSVEWKAENESNLKQYDVEKSVDGNHYAVANTVAAKNAALSNYKWLDVNASEGNNYYRIRSTDINGKIAYSTVVKVYMGKGKQSISVYPNPVVNGTVNLQLSNQPSGVYGIRLMNKLGQVMISKQINHTEGSSTETIQLDNYTPGIYQIEVSGPDCSKTNVSVSVLK